MIFSESFLLEATFLNAANLDRHYQKHVLQPGEVFNPDDPKFPHMSKEDYANRAETLSLVPAGDSEDRSSHIIGFEIEDGRRVKIHKRSPFYPRDRFCEVVMYVEDENRGTEIISYMLGRPGKLFRLKQHFVKELPENTPTVGEALNILEQLNEDE